MIIGLSGKQGTGKSTLAKAIQDTYTNVKIFKIAGTIYELQDYIYNRLGLTMIGEKDRPLLIAIGLWGRSKDENIWTNDTLRQALEHSRMGGIALIDDIRFPNEAKAIEDNLGVLIRIEGVQRGPNITEDMKTNESETALDNFNFKNIIDNKQDIETVRQNLLDILGGQ